MISVFNMSDKLVDYYQKIRLWPQGDKPQSIWGCASRDGFLAQGESLREICSKDRKTLEELGITYRQITDKIKLLIKTQIKEPEQLVDGFLKITFSEPTICAQFCPFSPEGADYNASPFTTPKKYCGGAARIDITIENTKIKEQVTFSELLLHLIEEHHFFEGSVEYRLAPEKIIKMLELKPDANYSLADEIAVNAQANQTSSLVNSLKCSIL